VGFTKESVEPSFCAATARAVRSAERLDLY
ncbi:MAG: hypothetical protein JWP07_3225, partial [Pseudonocardiales bacterium]|nr:hypothetical protein [Pseudonocardiales bacterium]